MDFIQLTSLQKKVHKRDKLQTKVSSNFSPLILVNVNTVIYKVPKGRSLRDVFVASCYEISGNIMSAGKY